MKKHKMSGIIILSLIIAMSSWLTGCQQATDEVPEERATSVAITEAAFGDLAVNTTLTGQVKPVEEVRLVPKIPGTVNQVHVSVGDSVSKGQTLITLDQRDMRNSARQAAAALSIAQAGLDTAQAGLASAEIQHQQAHRDLERTQTLFSQGAVTQQQLEQAEMAASETTLNTSRSQVAQAEAQVNQARVSLDIARASLQDTEIISPLAGMVVEINATAGEFLSSQGAATIIAQLDTMTLKTQVSEYLINRFASGQEVVLRIPAAFSGTVTGIVNTIAPAPATGTMTYPLEIHVANSEGLIKSGMFAEVEITTETRENSLLVPSVSVVVREGRTVVFLAEGDRAVMKEVIVGLDNGDLTEIAYGLKAGDHVVYQGQDFLEDGSLIQDTNRQDGDAS